MLNSRRSKTKARHARSFASDNENEIENKASNAERGEEKRWRRGEREKSEKGSTENEKIGSDRR